MVVVVVRPPIVELVPQVVAINLGMRRRRSGCERRGG
jgi:hypothetical protein